MEIRIMKKLTHLILTSFIVFAAQTSSAALLTFDDIQGVTAPFPNGQNSYGNMPTYKGFNFSSTLDWIDVVDSPSWNFGAHSDDFAIVNNELGAGFIVDAGSADFSFGGLWAKVYETPPESGDGDWNFSGFLRGFKNDTEIWNIAADLNGSYKFFGPQAGLIDQLRIDFGNRNRFLVDDITLSAAVVPVPAAAWLFGSGLIGLLGFARRRSQA
jgi:hypothetical protein